MGPPCPQGPGLAAPPLVHLEPQVTKSRYFRRVGARPGPPGGTRAATQGAASLSGRGSWNLSRPGAIIVPPVSNHCACRLPGARGNSAGGPSWSDRPGFPSPRRSRGSRSVLCCALSPQGAGPGRDACLPPLGLVVPCPQRPEREDCPCGTGRDGAQGSSQSE